MLKKLKYSDTVKEYMTEFTSLMLDIKNMPKDDELFEFFSGLQG